LISATAYGQLLSPKRIVFEKDTGIFFSSTQEVRLLVKMKQLEACQEEKAQWILYANKADKQVGEERIAYERLMKEYIALEGVARDFENKYNKEFQEHQGTKNALIIQTDKKRTWIKIAAASLTINAGLIYIISR
jgi:hypothetical protein